MITRNDRSPRLARYASNTSEVSYCPDLLARHSSADETGELSRFVLCIDPATTERPEHRSDLTEVTDRSLVRRNSGGVPGATGLETVPEPRSVHRNRPKRERRAPDYGGKEERRVLRDVTRHSRTIAAAAAETTSNNRERSRSLVRIRVPRKPVGSSPSLAPRAPLAVGRGARGTAEEWARSRIFGRESSREGDRANLPATFRASCFRSSFPRPLRRRSR